MSASTKLQLIFIILILTVTKCFSQYYIKFKGDSVAFEKDSVILTLDNIIANNLNWEISKDSVTWESLNKTNDTLVVRIHDNSFYRAVLTEGTCYPIKSDVAFAGFKSIEVSDNSFVIDLTGGVYILPSGIKLVVPPKAVNENVTVTLDLLDSLNAEIQIPFDADIGKMFCAAIQCEPIQFLKPVKISIPAPNIHHNDLPYVYQFDGGSGFWKKFTGKLICSEASQFIEFYTNELVSTRIQLLKNVYGFNNQVKAAEPQNPKPNNYDCRSLLGVVEVIAYDHFGQIGKTECYVLNDEYKASYPLCEGKPVETSKNIEIGKDCTPEVEDNIENICLKKDESKTITVKVTIGGLPLKGQHIDFFEIPEGISISPIAYATDSNGEATFTITSTKEELRDTIKYRVSYDYFLEIVSASAGSVTENNKNHRRMGPIVKDRSIKSCPILASIEITNADVMLLEHNESMQLNCLCLDEFGKSMDCENVEYHLVPWGDYPVAGASVSETGLLSATSGGVVRIIARSGGIESKRTKIATVEYKGSMSGLEVTSDHNIYKQCACKEDLEKDPTNFNWWIVKYTGGLNISIYLNPDPYLLPISHLTGDGTIIYSISGSNYCTGATIPESISSHSEGWLTFPGQSGTSPYVMENLINGKKCIVEFQYEDFRKFYWHILRGTVQLTSSGIEFSILDWRPDGCIHKDVEGSCILK